jgi:hypothetical protein
MAAAPYGARDHRRHVIARPGERHEKKLDTIYSMLMSELFAGFTWPTEVLEKCANNGPS